MTAADDAYKAAEQAIAKTLRDSATSLELDNSETHALTRLPPEIGTLTTLQRLTLNSTQVSDLAPLQRLTSLQTLTLNSTQVSDLAPLQDLTNLQTLALDSTQITDLRSVRDLAALIKGPMNKLAFRPGLHFQNTAATRADPELKRLSGIDDAAERTTATLAYLHTLPPWPQPLPWEVPAEPPTTEPGDVDQDAALRLVWGDNGFAFLVDQIAADPVVIATLAEVRDLLNDLRRLAGNQHEDLYRLAEELLARSDGAADQIDHLKLHFSYQKLKRMLDNRAARRDKLDDETVTAMTGIAELVPGVTLADPAVQILIQRQDQNRALATTGIDAARENAVLANITEADAPFDNAVKEIAAEVLKPDQTDRLAATRPTLSRNALVVTVRTLKWGGLAMVSGVLGGWAYANSDTLLSMALSMGDDVYWWAKAVLDKVKAAYEARLPGP